MKKLIFSLLFVGLAMSFVGCPEDAKRLLDDSLKDAANGDTDGGGSACLDNADCPIGMVCKDKKCISLFDDEAECLTNEDCGEKGICRDGYCVGGGADDDDDSGDGPGPDVTQELEISPSSLEFGGISVGTPVEKTLKITNKGSRDITIQKISFDSATSSEFRLNPSPIEQVILSPEGVFSFSVIYTAKDELPDTGTLLIVNSSVQPLIEIPMASYPKGEVEIAFYESSDLDSKAWPKPDGKAFEINFGDKEVGSFDEKVYVIKNEGSGTAALAILEAKIKETAGTDYPMFRFEFMKLVEGRPAEAPQYINNGEILGVKFIYNPTAKGVHSAEAEFKTNDKDVNNDGTSGDTDVIVALKGRAGFEPASISVSDAKIDFGEVLVGQKKCEEVTITNSSADDALELDIGFAGEAEEFTLNNAPVKVEPEQKAKFEVCFEPSKTGKVTKSLQINSNDINNQLIEISLTGTGVTPELTISPEPPVLMGDVVISTVFERIITLRNGGGGKLQVSGISITGSIAFSIDQISKTLPANLGDKNDSLTFRIRFAPAAVGNFVGEARITHNSNEDGFTTFAVSGNGVEPSEAGIKIVPENIAFGVVSLGDTLQRTIVVQNTGTAPLAFGSVFVTNSPSDFSVVSVPTLIPVAGMDNLVVGFSPTKVGDRSDILMIQTNAKNTPNLMVSLTGQGTGSCTPSDVQTEACGMCGSRQRICGTNGQWGDWSECAGQGVCVPGSEEQRNCGTKCGIQNRTCNPSCYWNDWGICTGEGECTAGTIDTVSCGNCGTKTRTCAQNCTWPEYSSCTGEGICSPTASETCNVCGTRVCSTQCQWGDCSVTLESVKDSLEPNDSRSTAYSVGEDSDCDGDKLPNNNQTVANMVPLGEVDWYRAYFKDNWNCSIDNVSFKLINIPAGQDYDMIAYMDTSDCRSDPKCKSGSVACTNSDPDCSDLPSGVKGCKSVKTGNQDEEIRFDCFGGGSSDSGNIYVRIKPKQSSGGSCSNYTILWDLR